MKKLKFVLILAACLFALTGCEESAKVEEEKAAQLIDMSYSILMDWVDNPDYYEMVLGLGPEAVEYVYGESFRINVDGNGMASGIESYFNAVNDIGKFVSVTGSEVGYESSGKGIVVTLICQFENRTADVEYVYEDSFYSPLTSSATNIEYTFGEKMEKAGLNTVLGMGTVFIVLILIYGIISLFSLIPKIQDAFSKKNTTVTEATESVDNAIAQIEKSEELTDDLELVAVITAAIAASEGKTSTDGYVVRSIKRVNKSKWQKAF